MMEFSIFSHGGVGSKLIVKWLYPDAPASLWSRAHRHDPSPPAHAPGQSQMIYVFGDPRNAAISVFQRRDGRHERHGFASRPAAARERPVPDFVMKHARNLGVDPGPMDESWSLSAFAEAGCDLLGFERHVEAWLSSRAPDPVLFIRYETFWEHLPAIGERLGIHRPPASFVPRRADWRSQPATIQDGLNRIYGPLCERLADLPDVFMLQGGQST